MNKQPEKKHSRDRGGAPQEQSSQNWGRQMVGAVLGVVLGLILALVLRAFGWGGGSLVRYALWGGVIGAMLAGIESLEGAGRRLTRRDTPWLNILVAIVGMAIVLAAIMGLAYGLALLFQGLMP